MKSEEEVNAAIERHADTVRRVCFLHIRNYADVEDVFQEIFLKYILCEHAFESEEHERAWLIRVASNQCKDLLKDVFRRRVHSLDDIDISSFSIEEEDRELLDTVLHLPDKYRDVIYLHYYEGYPAVEIARILGKRENTIYTWLSRARKKLKESLGGESFET